MKKTAKLLVVMMLYFGLILINTSAFASTAKTVNSSTRLREKASVSSGTVTVLNQGQEVEIIAKEGDWYKVRYKSKKYTYEGYIRADLLDLTDKNESEKNDNNDTSNEVTNNSAEQNTSNEQTVSENNSADQNSTVNEISTESNEEAENNTNSENSVQVNENNQQEIVENQKFKLKNKIDVRILPLINSCKLETLSENSEITITEIIGEWCYVESTQKSGWSLVKNIEKQDEISKSNMESNSSNIENESTSKEISENKTLYVSATTVNLREKADTSSKVLKQLSINSKVTLIENVDKTWSKVKYSGTTGYVASKYLSEKKQTISRSSEETRTSNSAVTESTTKTASTEKSTNSNTETADSKKEENNNTTEKENTNTSKNSTNSVTGDDIVNYAKKYLGCKYVYGGTTPEGGFDCSGFTQYVYKHFGYSIYRTATDQRSNGVSVKKENLQKGDLVCFSGHVGIYIGGNQFIHAANPKKGVVITSLSDSYYVKNYVTSRRIL